MITSAIETVDPSQAQIYLATSLGNRKINWAEVARWTKYMQEGKWCLNGQGIVFDDQGHLLEGHHRLSSVVKAGIPVDFLVVRGVDPAVKDTIDTGTSRSPAHVFQFNGEANSVLLASGLSWLYRYTNNKLRLFQKLLVKDHLQPLLNQNPDFRASVQFVANSRKSKTQNITKLLTPGVAVCLHYLIMSSDPIKGQKFFDQLISGANLNENNPTYVLRERLRDEARDTKKKEELKFFVLTIKAWNAFKADARITKLRYSSEETAPTVM